MRNLAGERVLLTTFGFDETKVLRAMRGLSYDRLVVLLGEDALEGPGYAHIARLESLAGRVATPVTVDVFDFSACFRAVAAQIQDVQSALGRPILNVSGGTKVLADAAILAAFHHGVEAYHCEDDLVRLPVLVGVDVGERFTPTQRAVLRTLRRGDTVRDLAARSPGINPQSVRRAVNALLRMGLLDQWLDAGRLRLDVARAHAPLMDSLRGPHQP